MQATISVPESAMGAVVHDLNSARGAQIVSLGGEDSDSETSSASDVIIDTAKIYAPPDPFGSGGEDVATARDAVRQISARVPLREMVGYLKHLRSLTGGRGTFVMMVEGFEKVQGQRLKSILGEMRGGI
jgi:elongation factor G